MGSERIKHSHSEAKGVRKFLSQSREELEIIEFRNNEKYALALIKMKIYNSHEIPTTCLAYFKKYWNIRRDIYNAVTDEEVKSSQEEFRNLGNNYPEEFEKSAQFVAALRLISGNFSKSPGRDR